MKKMLVLLAWLGLFAEELPDMVVTASRVEAHSGATAQNVEIISGEQLELSRYQTVTEALQYEPSITLHSYGPRDSASGGISIRGMSTYHTKLLIDGVPFMDNSTPQQTPMFGNLMLTDVDHIEILKGAVSLQGSSAMGGVVNIVTHRPDRDGIEAKVTLEGGSYEHFSTGAVVLGKFDFFDFKAGVGYEHERGISAVRKDVNNAYDTDYDAYQNQSYFGRIGLQFTEKLRLEANGLFQDIDEEYDEWGDFESDDIWTRRNQWSGRLEAKDLFDGMLDTRLVYSYTRSDRIYKQLSDPWLMGYTKRFIGETHFVDWMTTLHFTEQYALSVGLEYDEQRARNINVEGDATLKAIHRTRSAYAGLQAEPIENLFLSLNGRYTHHSEFGSEWTGDASAKYYLEMTGTSFRGSVGKGYRAPSVYELYLPLSWGYFSGNPDLEPEYSTTWEAGVDQELFDKSLKFGATYFENYVDNYIIFPAWPASTYEQIDGVVVNGIESYVEYKLDESLSLRVAYTWQNGRDRRKLDNKHIPLLPAHKISFDGTWFPPLPERKLALNIGGAWNSRRWNGDKTDKLEDYALVHASATYFITEHIECYFRVDNIFNTHYVLMESGGTTYNTYGRTYYLGVVFSF